MNAALGLVSGAVATLGQAEFPSPGLISPESLTIGFAGLVASVGLPSPWGVVTSGGVVVHAHGTQTGQDTTNYTVNFAPLVPATGSVTAYLAASVIQIQQNPFPLTGPPQGHPSFNPNFVPSTAYASNTWSVSLAAVTGVPDNVNTFEVFRTTLTAGQSSLTAVTSAGWKRAATYAAQPALPFAAGGIMTLAQAQSVVSPTVAGLSQTLPAAAAAGGLRYTMVNPLTAGNWTVVAQGADLITGAAAQAASLAIPPGGAMQLWGNAASGQWDVVGANPLLMASLANTFTAPQTITTAVTTGLTVAGSSAQGANIALIGNGATTPNKYIRAVNGNFSIVNSAYTVQILALDDNGNISVPGQVQGGSLSAGTATISGNLTVGGAEQINGNLNVTGGISAGAGGVGTTGAVTAGAGGFYSATGPVNVGGAITATGNILSAARLRAVLGAYNSGDANAAAILADFFISGGSPGYLRMPNGVLMQGGTINTANDVAVFFPLAFPHVCMAVVLIESNAVQTWGGGTAPTVHGVSSKTLGGFVHYSFTWNGAGWTPAGNQCDYISIGF